MARRHDPPADGSRPRAWQRMLSGRRLDLLAPVPADIDVGDIAHGLARVARWNGQTAGVHVFSVAQHSLFVEHLAGWLEPALTAPEQLAALLHDAPEYVIGDLISPFKAVVGHAYRSVEQRILDAIHRRFDVPAPSPALDQLIKKADRAAAFIEAIRLAGFDAAEASRLFGPVEIDPCAFSAQTEPLATGEAEQLFLRRFSALHEAASPAGTGNIS